MLEGFKARLDRLFRERGGGTADPRAVAAALGPILRAGVAAVEREVGPERTYVMSFNERLRHLHFYILPRTRNLPRGHVMSDMYKRGRALLRQTGIARNPAPADRAEMAERLRADPAWIRLTS